MTTKRIAIAAMLATLLVQSPLLASENLVNVGQDEDGYSFLLDTTSVNAWVRGLGYTMKVYRVGGRINAEMLLSPSCSEKRLFIVRSVIRVNGTKVRESKTREELPVVDESPTGKLMQIYCKSIDAVGW
jgi:hypothetical protein